MMNSAQQVSALEDQKASKSAKLARLKNNVKLWHDYYKENNDRYHEWRKTVFKSAYDNQQLQQMGELEILPLEFNVLEAYLSRNVGEFSEQEPGFIVQQMPDAPNMDPRLVKVIEGHFDAILYMTKKDQFQDNIFEEAQSGGYSAFQVSHEYSSPYTFNQDIIWRKCDDPTMCGWDVLARAPHKGDGDYCFRLIAMTDKQFKDKYPDVNLNSLSYKTLGGYSWSYKYGGQNIILICNYYEKVKKRKTLCFLADKTAMLESDYRQMLKTWDKIEQPPAIQFRRKTEVTTIRNIVFMETEILEEMDTIYTELPIIFVNGNSKYLRDGAEGSNMNEFIRPYFYQAIGAQKLKNIAGQSLARELESLVQHKFIAPLEGIPEQYTEAYKKPQKANTLIYRAFLEDGLTQIEPPREIMRPPIPPEVAGTFMQTDQNIQNILGAYNPQPETQNQLTGVAIEKAALQSSAAAKPYIINYLAALNQGAQLTIAMFPKIYFNARSIMIINEKGQQEWVPINGFAGSDLAFKYKDEAMSVTIEAGVNFEVQKQMAMTMMIQLAQALPAFNELVNTAGLGVVLDNLDFRGADQLKAAADKMMKQKEEQSANTPPPPDPNTLKAQDIQMRAQQNQMQNQIAQQRLELDAHKMAMEHQKEMTQAHVDLIKDATDKSIEKARLHLEARDMAHDHAVNVHKQHMDEQRHHHEKESSAREHDRADKESAKKESKE